MPIDSAILSAASALVGSLIGGVATFAGSWVAQREQLRAQMLVQESVKRETLYAEFIIEASKRFAEAWNHEAEGPEVLATLYAAVERMRLTSSPEIVRIAQDTMRYLIEAYAAPRRTFEELQELMRTEEFRDPLRDFSEACRAELRAFRR